MIDLRRDLQPYKEKIDVVFGAQARGTDAASGMRRQGS